MHRAIARPPTRQSRNEVPTSRASRRYDRKGATKLDSKSDSSSNLSSISSGILDVSSSSALEDEVEESEHEESDANDCEHLDSVAQKQETQSDSERQDQGIFPSMLANPSYVAFIQLRLELHDIPSLDVNGDASAQVEWTYWEVNGIGQSPKFTLKISNGWDTEYIPSRGSLSGNCANGTPFCYHFANANISNIAAREFGDCRKDSTQPSLRLRSIIRLCQLLAMRCMQLRKAALALDPSKLPFVHFDTLPDSLMNSLRQESLDIQLRDRLLAASRAKLVANSVDIKSSCAIVGVGNGHLDTDGSLQIEFDDGSQLTLDANGSQLRFRPSITEAREDVFELSTLGGSSLFLPTVVRKHLERVPAFIRQLRGIEAK